MTGLVPLHFDAADVRIVMRDGEPWWVGLDVTALLDIAKGHQALAALEDYERGTYIIGTLGGPQQTTIINESGLYSLILRSRKPVAKKFKRWLTTDVLPSIRKYGVYPPPAQIAELEAEFIPSTRAGRFMQELGAFEAASGKTIGEVTGIHPNRLRVIELSQDGIGPILARKNLWIILISLGFDLRYIFFGQRSNGGSQFPSAYHDSEFMQLN